MKAGKFAGLGVAGVAAMLAMSAGVRAEEGVAIKNILGSMGIVPVEKDPIPYRERAPLVMPPKMELRDPVAPGQARAANPQWPNDPDVAAKRRKEADARAPVTHSETRRMSGSNPTLTQEELRAGRRAGAGIVDGPAPHRGERHGVWVNPDDLRAQGRTKEAENVHADGTPVRRLLTDPPNALSRSATGRPIEKGFEAPERVDEVDIRGFIRQQAGE